MTEIFFSQSRKREGLEDISKEAVSFSQRTVNEWNRLSADCVGASSVNIFKNKIDIYLRLRVYLDRYVGLSISQMAS